MTRSDIKFILSSFIVWRFGLFVITFFAAKFVPLQHNFLGGQLANYTSNPLFWLWGNFDGQHYVSIAQNGYGFGQYTFFPLYPMILRILGQIFGNSTLSLNLIGQAVSNLSFIVALIGFYKLARIDYTEKVSKIAVILLLLFPMSFYFSAVYTESLFLALLVWSFYFSRQGRTGYASFLGLFITALRPVGIFIFPAILIEWYVQNRKNKCFWRTFPFEISAIPVGLMGYMYFLKTHLGNAFAFFSQQVYVGEHRSRNIILIPQNIYRYIFKIFPNLNYSYFPGVFFTFLEFLAGTAYLGISILLFFTTRTSYAVFVFLAYITPTFLGSFSSMPRYVLILFPVYFLTAKFLSKSKPKLFAFCLVSAILLVISLSLFSRGFWIS